MQILHWETLKFLSFCLCLLERQINSEFFEVFVFSSNLIRGIISEMWNSSLDRGQCPPKIIAVYYSNWFFYKAFNQYFLVFYYSFYAGKIGLVWNQGYFLSLTLMQKNMHVLFLLSRFLCMKSTVFFFFLFWYTFCD